MDNPNTFSLTSRNIPFNVKLVFHNEHYGLNDCLTYKGYEPMVEFYDARYPDTDHGQFISRYYITTLLEGNENKGICLEGSEPDWNIEDQDMNKVKEWLSNHSTLQEVISHLPAKNITKFKF